MEYDTANNFDENEDIILPDTVWGEVVYIYCILSDMLKRPEKSGSNLTALLRQIRFFIRWKKFK